MTVESYTILALNIYRIYPFILCYSHVSYSLMKSFIVKNDLMHFTTSLLINEDI